MHLDVIGLEFECLAVDGDTTSPLAVRNRRNTVRGSFEVQLLQEQLADADSKNTVHLRLAPSTFFLSVHRRSP